ADLEEAALAPATFLIVLPAVGRDRLQAPQLAVDVRHRHQELAALDTDAARRDALRPEIGMPRWRRPGAVPSLLRLDRGDGLKLGLPGGNLDLEPAQSFPALGSLLRRQNPPRVALAVLLDAEPPVAEGPRGRDRVIVDDVPAGGF